MTFFGTEFTGSVGACAQFRKWKKPPLFRKTKFLPLCFSFFANSKKYGVFGGLGGGGIGVARGNFPLSFLCFFWFAI